MCLLGSHPTPKQVQKLLDEILLHFEPNPAGDEVTETDDGTSVSEQHTTQADEQLPSRGSHTSDDQGLDQNSNMTPHEDTNTTSTTHGRLHPLIDLETLLSE